MKFLIKICKYRSRKIYQASFLIAAIVLSGLSFRTSHSLAAPASSLFLDPATKQVNKDDTFTLNLKINPGTNLVSGIETYLTFDRTKLRMDDITVSSEFSGANGFEMGRSINNDNGTANITVVKMFGTSVTSEVVVATFDFTAIAEGSGSPVSITNESLVTADNETGNVLVSRTGSSVTIGNNPPHDTYTIDDFTNLKNNWLQSATAQERAKGNVNDDTIVDSRDLGIMMSYWAAAQ